MKKNHVQFTTTKKTTIFVGSPVKNRESEKKKSTSGYFLGLFGLAGWLADLALLAPDLSHHRVDACG